MAAWVLCLGSASSAGAQQPFLVDDAEVAPSRLWHLEISSQVDVLRSAARPVRWQNVLEWEVNYGLGARIEPNKPARKPESYGGTRAELLDTVRGAPGWEEKRSSSSACAISAGVSCKIGVITTSFSTPSTSGATSENFLAMAL